MRFKTQEFGFPPIMSTKVPVLFRAHVLGKGDTTLIMLKVLCLGYTSQPR